MKKTPTIENKTAWYNEHLSADDYVEIKDGVCVIPYVIIRDKLDMLTNNTWSTKNFFFRITMFNGVESIVGSVEVEVTYEGITRTLVGARTLALPWIKSLSKPELGEDANEEYLGTLLSLCIVRAVKPIGVQFGRDLNRKEFINVIPSIVSDFNAIKEKYELIKTTILMSPNKEMAQKFLDKSEFGGNEQIAGNSSLQELVNQKPSSLLKDLMK